MKKIALALLLATVTFQASAAAVFTDRAAWTGATTVAKTVDFEGATSSLFYAGYSYQSGGMTFTSSQTGDGIYVISPNFSSVYTTGTGAALFSDQFPSTVTVSLGGAYGAFGIDLRGYYGGVDNYTITLSDNQVFNLNSASTTAFFGVVLDHTINSVKIDSTYYTAFDNVSIGAATRAVPEPASVALLGLGMLGLMFARRKSAK